MKPLYSFRDTADFIDRHKTGTELDFKAQALEIDDLNKQSIEFKAWPLLQLRKTKKRSEWLFLVHPGNAEERRGLPQEGGLSKVRIVYDDGNYSQSWDAFRVDNPVPSLGIRIPGAENLAAFTNSLDCDANLCAPFGSIILDDSNAVKVNFYLIASESTMNAELSALDRLTGQYWGASDRQLQAFEYFVLLKNPAFTVNLHKRIPHLKDVLVNPLSVSPQLLARYMRLNAQQKLAYKHGFTDIPCGICILPGGPGAGKTHFNLFTIAMAQSKPLPKLATKNKDQIPNESVKVLFMVDMNSPVDDVANRMVRLYDDLGMNKRVIRMKGWGYEIKSSDRVNAAEDAAIGEDLQVDFSHQFLRVAKVFVGQAPETRNCKAMGLDEAAWQHYDNHQSNYTGITEYLNEQLWEEDQVIPWKFRCMVFALYRDTLADADFIATTPVAASTLFRGMFKPDLVYFDEAPHARELSNLIAIANFDPMAWIFCGDYRQTQPHVSTDKAMGEDGPVNIHSAQMQVSMMKRAEVAHAIKYELLINHRAFGGLQELASTLWYSRRMVSGNLDKAPTSLTYIRNYLGQFMGGRTCTVPRVLIHLKGCGPEVSAGNKSAWNPTHAKWVMKRVRELLFAKEFTHAERDEPGTILIISPYKKAFEEYKEAIKGLPQDCRHRVEARTVDVVQGHEADFVFLDLVKTRSTEFLDNGNRLCVAVTRARLGEVIMMHPEMVRSYTFRKKSENLRRIWEKCNQDGQAAMVDPEDEYNMEQVADKFADDMSRLQLRDLKSEDETDGSTDKTRTEEEGQTINEKSEAAFAQNVNMVCKNEQKKQAIIDWLMG
ncbi:P-loop containing nucleoside triphosphate hydrolase protein [Diplogelasinospora grovesii]|uniref:P-loop containing nucleoside triphosphate hydrolase protein n=1 Tax=Diplogelasinospora grovesii TaxID=303347 RepID=A0AAN6S307_9PEZI|nr:P-loop containing nucleoside triphosphate hydrolase protein [Diplogelasinospora grovesii]